MLRVGELPDGDERRHKGTPDHAGRDRPPDGAIKLSPEILAQMNTGFHLAHAEPLDLPVVMTHDQYLAYLKTEVNVPDPPFQPEWRLQFRGYLAFLRVSASARQD